MWFPPRRLCPQTLGCPLERVKSSPYSFTCITSSPCLLCMVHPQGGLVCCLYHKFCCRYRWGLESSRHCILVAPPVYGISSCASFCGATGVYLGITLHS